MYNIIPHSPQKHEMGGGELGIPPPQIFEEPKISPRFYNVESLISLFLNNLEEIRSDLGQNPPDSGSDKHLRSHRD